MLVELRQYSFNTSLIKVPCNDVNANRVGSLVHLWRLIGEHLDALSLRCVSALHLEGW